MTTRLAILLAACALTPALAPAFAQQAPSDAPARTSLEATAEQAARGEVYRVVPAGDDAQIAFTSDAPLERFVGESHSARGFAVVGGLTDLVAGAFAVPVTTITTGIPLRDEHLASDRWLHADRHPDIRFTLATTRGFTEIRTDHRYTTLVGDLVGDLTIAGVTRELIAPATLVFMPESDITRAEAPGDLIAIRAAFDVRLDDFGVGASDPARRTGAVAETIRVQVRLLLSDSDAFAPPTHAARDDAPDASGG
ncbi:MAG: YceI family protein [Phycisphaerales bacterium]